MTNVRGRAYFIARTEGRCGHCHALTSLVALALPPGHETLALDDCAESESAADSWSISTHNAFLFHLEYVPATVQRRLKEHSPSFRLVNHCGRCDLPFDDLDMFCEPGGAFLPWTVEQARGIRIVTVDEWLEVGAAGYTFDPEYFADMSRG